MSDAHSMSPADFKKMLRLCNTHGVSRLKTGYVEIEFFRDGHQATGVRQTDQGRASAEAGAKSLEQLDPSLAAEMLRTQQLIDDPMGFEQDQIDGR